MKKTNRKNNKKRPQHRRIMGKNCIHEVLRHCPERLVSVHTCKPEHAPDDLLKELQKANIPIHYHSKAELTSSVDSESHQSFVAQLREKPQPDLSFMKEEETPRFILALDSITDPQNVGALLRSAECFGVDAVIWSKNRGPAITPTVSKVSVGASELVTTYEVSNLVETLKTLKDKGYWVVTSEVGPGTEDLSTFSFPERTVLVMGSEGKGVRSLVSKHADFKVYIPMFGHIDSLNVSQATAVFLSHWKLSK